MCVSVTRNIVKMVFRQRDGLIAHTNVTCRNTFVFMCVVVLESAVLVIYRVSMYQVSSSLCFSFVSYMHIHFHNVLLDLLLFSKK